MLATGPPMPTPIDILALVKESKANTAACEPAAVLELPLKWPILQAQKLALSVPTALHYLGLTANGPSTLLNSTRKGPKSRPPRDPQ